MATVEATFVTADEFWDWVDRPENQSKHWELDEGEIVEMPPPGELHGIICGWMIYLFWQFVVRRGKGAVAGNDTGLLVGRNPDTVRGPDIMVFAESRKKDELSRKYTERVPALIVEVLSPQDKQGRTNRRISQYLARGVPLVWVVDPEDQMITVYRPNREHYVVDAREEITGEDALPDFRFRVAEFFTLPGDQTQTPLAN
jgi:Uma2 family endonuclease